MPAAAQSSVLLAMSAPPYWHCGRTVRRQSLMTLAALLPAVIGAVWTWGLPAVRVMSLCVAVAVLTEAACQKLMGRELAIDDYTAVCSGLLLSFMLPADAPWWIAVMAPLIAISLGKMAFGGLGANPVNTSVVGWAVLFVSFPLFMEPNAVQLNAASMVDPLVRLKFFGWADAGIKTVDQAKDDAAAHSQIYYSVMKALGITGRNLVDSEVSLINKWVGEYGFDIELVKAACSKTISAIQKPSFEYTDSILANWRKKDVHTLKDVEVLDANFAKANKASATLSLIHI